jgi:hypothetical protein
MMNKKINYIKQLVKLIIRIKQIFSKESQLHIFNHGLTLFSFQFVIYI